VRYNLPMAKREVEPISAPLYHVGQKVWWTEGHSPHAARPAHIRR
jgi:hypothetical protein